MPLRHLVFVLAPLLALLLGTSAQAQTTRYTIFSETGDKKLGDQIVERSAGGRMKISFHYRDNGRGPDLEEELRLAADGTLVEYRVLGQTTFGSKVNERFTRSGDKASWAATSEKGEVDVKGSAQYVPLNSSFELAGLNWAALAARTDGKLPLLPNGSLTQRKLDQVRISANGKTRTVVLFAQVGLGLSPNFVWIDAQEKRLFAQIYTGYLGAIEEGWMPVKANLVKRQLAAEKKLLAEMAQRLQPALTGLTVIRNARIFDSEHARLLPAADVFVLRGRIASISAPGSNPSRGKTEIDAAGRVLLPGLFDMHGHADRWSGALNMAAGVTTVRDLGNDNATLPAIIDETEAGSLLGPQIVPAGFLEGDSPYASNWGFVIKTLPEAKNAIDWYAAHGYPQLKIYNSFPKEILTETVAYAHARGMRVSGHVPAFLRAEDVVNAGFDELQHINQVMLNFLVKPDTDTRTLERFYLPARAVADLDLDSKPLQDFLRLLKEKNVAVDPTLVTFDFLRQQDGTMAKPYAPVADHLPPDVKRNRYVAQMDIPDDATLKRYEASYAKMVQYTGMMYRAGIPLVAGTDEVAGFTLHAELAMYVEAGLTPSQALQVGTLNGARFSRVLADRGSIAVGKLADLVLVDGDPTTDIGDLRKTALVLTRGRMISPSKIYESMGIKPFTNWNPVITRNAKVD